MEEINNEIEEIINAKEWNRSEYMKEYRKRNRDRLSEYQRTYNKKKYDESEEFRSNIKRNNIKYILKKYGNVIETN